mmetsp:Transcript_33882/g.74380  ORF Transcript_33882/g.74380 Transcript_33882/m.74380 type:complete len:127 (+) Transcript_33882:257-637(+)
MFTTHHLSPPKKKAEILFIVAMEDIRDSSQTEGHRKEGAHWRAASRPTVSYACLRLRFDSAAASRVERVWCSGCAALQLVVLVVTQLAPRDETNSSASAPPTQRRRPPSSRSDAAATFSTAGAKGP